MLKSVSIFSVLFLLTGCGGSSSGGGNSAPVITVRTTIVPENLSENNTEVDKSYTVVDADNDPINYSLTGGEDQNLFSINATTGVVTFLIAPDFENPTDSDGDNFYLYQIGASDGMVTTNSIILSVEILNANDNAPIFSSASSISINENDTSGITVTVDDADNSSIFVQTFSLSGGDDQASFTIDSSSGALSFINAPDFETPTDSDANNIYLVEVTLTDDPFVISQSIEVTVTDVNEAQFGLTSRPSNTTCALPDPPDLSTSIELNRVFTSLSFDRPIALRQSPTVVDRWYVAEQNGVIRTFMADDATSTVFADLTTPVSTSGNEMGLLGMAFHPNFANNNFVYLYYSTAGGAQHHQSIISRFTAISAMVLDLNSELELMRIEQPFGNHNGGNILFGPDGYLYIGMGDGGSGGDPQDHAQNSGSLLGKMLRIDVDNPANGNNYSSPADNPYVGVTGFDEIYAIGLRNPWRWSFDRQNGNLLAGDVGQNNWEEVDIITNNGNYGWRCYEATNAFNTSGCQAQNTYDAPIHEYDHNDGFSITGGYVYRGSAIPSLNGTYIYSDYGSGPIWGITDPAGANPVNTELVTANFFISSFAEDNNGELYALNFSNGQIFRIEPASGSGTGNFPDLLSETGCIDISAPLSMASGLIPYDINAPFWSDGAIKERWMALTDGTEITIEASGDWTYPTNSVLVKNFEINGRRIETRLLARHADGSWGGYSYEWNDAETDANLVLNGKVIDKEGQSYIFPGTTDCMICHTTIAGIALGPETQQLNRNITYPSTGINANQLATLENIGMFSAALPDIPDNLARLISPTDLSATPHDRARSYLYTNCSQCHQQGGPTNVTMDFHINTADTDMNICNQTPIHQIDGANAIMAAGDAAGSSMVLRMSCREGVTNCTSGDEMPPLGSTIVDTEGVNIVSSWIDSLSGCP